MAGEFGRRGRGLRLELFGVARHWRGGGVGRSLFEALAVWARRHGIGELRTAALWRDTAILSWFDTMGFDLAPDRIVECAVGDAPISAREDRAGDEPAGDGSEIDYGRHDAAGANDHDRAERDTADVRTMTQADLDAIVRVDRRITGSDRRDYIGGRLAEALGESAVRVSLSARCDGAVVGYLMARADLGDFGRTEPVAVIDTLGVDPDYAHRGVGRALLSQLFANLGALRVERVETIVPQHELTLLAFMYAAGFAPAQRLSFGRRLGAVA